jgi:tetratricopeptide (TPR) repeat protein
MTLSPDLEGTLRRYALGRLAEELRLALEERLVTEPDVLEALGVVEEELTEEYLERSLSEDERRDYEQSFLASPERQRLLGFVDSLKARASGKKPVPLPVRRPSVATWQLGWALAASLLLALSVTGNVWQGLKAAVDAKGGRPVEEREAGAAVSAEVTDVVVTSKLVLARADFENHDYAAAAASAREAIALDPNNADAKALVAQAEKAEKAQRDLAAAVAEARAAVARGDTSSATAALGRVVALQQVIRPTPALAASPTATVAARSAPSERPRPGEELADHTRLAVAEPRGLRTSVPSFLLASGVLRGSGSMTRVSVPAGAIGIRLLLALPGAEYRQYRATLRSAEGDELWTAARLQAEHGSGRSAVVLLLPSELLPRGDYLIELAGMREGGEPEPLASYTFRVTGE